MSEAAVEDRPLVSQPSGSLIFMAMRDGLRLTKKKRYPIRNPQTGEVSGLTQGEYIGFRDGRFVCPPTGTVTLVDTLDGGVAEIDAEELIAWLRKHRLFDDKHEGFWLVEQPAPTPSKEELERLMDAAVNLRDDVLEQIIEQERAGWGREAVIETAERSLQQIRSMKQTAAEEAALEVQEAQARQAAETTAAQAAEVEAKTAAKSRTK